MDRNDLLQLYVRLGLTPIPLKPRSKIPLVRWRRNWNPSPSDLAPWASQADTNWGVRCGPNLVAFDFDDSDSFRRFVASHQLPPGCPIVRTGRGFHIWVKPRRPVATRRVDGLEVKGRGSYVVAPPSVHPDGMAYTFEVAPNGALPEVDVEELLGLGQMDLLAPARQDAPARPKAPPSDFAIRYGKSAYPRSLCGLATKVLTRSDGNVKHLVSMRDWKWDCPKCAPLLKRYWREKLGGLPFRFIVRAPTWDKPTRFLRRLGKPRYVHIVNNGEGWIFLIDGEAKKVWAEAHAAGYELVAGDIAGGPTPEDIEESLEEALCREDEPLNTRRKITHSRGVLTRVAQGSGHYESNEQTDCGEVEKDMKATCRKELSTWESEVVMKPIDEVAKELEGQGWRILWRSEVEATAIRGEAPEMQTTDLVELLDMLGIKLKKVGGEYMGLCPFHNDHKPSLSVNREKGLWHCFGCGKGGDANRFVEYCQKLS